MQRQADRRLSCAVEQWCVGRVTESVPCPVHGRELRVILVQSAVLRRWCGERGAHQAIETLEHLSGFAADTIDVIERVENLHGVRVETEFRAGEGDRLEVVRRVLKL